jgi:tRNA dimethylallyltransferase
MDSSDAKQQVIVLSGATSAGKSAVAMELSRKIDCEIVVCDSVQIYKHLDIGANKPTAEERAQVPHHLVDIRDPRERCSSGDFVRMSVAAIRDILARGKTPIIVGGTTMWLQWLVHGPPDAPAADPQAAKLAGELLDPFEKIGNWDAAVEYGRRFNDGRINTIARNDWYRMRRIYEIGIAFARATAAGPTAGGPEGGSKAADISLDSDNDSDNGRAEKSNTAPSTLSGTRKKMLNDLDLRCFFICEEREQLYRTIDQRCDDMLQAGLFGEVAELLLKDQLTTDSMGAKAIGYRQTIEYLLRNPAKNGDAQAFNDFLM